MKQQQTVFVGISGGVDSAVAALRLKQAGYGVVGVFIKVWQPDWLTCDWKAERLDAMRVAAHLNIPFLTCDAEAAYRDEVAQYFISDYQAGRTPNPDVMCNQHVKFGAFLKFARARGADYIATGHYAQVRLPESNLGVSSRTDLEPTYTLHRGVDNEKDQSYFLWTLTQAQLAHILLPVGNSSKKASIRAEAAAAGLPVARKKDSQGVCFLGHIDIPEFLSHYIDLTPGDVTNPAGEVIGTHQGAFVYTLGQRHGFTLHEQNPNRTPYYVIERDVTNNRIVVDTKPPQLHANTQISLSQCNWIEAPRETDTLTAQFRYRQTPFLVTLKTEAATVVIEPQAEVEQPAAGQSCVIYRDNQCLGGGIIE